MRSQGGAAPSIPAGDSCPASLAAVEAVVAKPGYPITRIYLATGTPICDPWRRQEMCGTGGLAMMVGGSQYGWVAFAGTRKVAAVTVDRIVPDRRSLAAGATPGLWQAGLMTFAVPPAGWGWP